MQPLAQSYFNAHYGYSAGGALKSAFQDITQQITNLRLKG